MSDINDSPSRRSNRISGRNPINDIDPNNASTSKELKSLLSSGGAGGKFTNSEDSWTFFSPDNISTTAHTGQDYDPFSILPTCSTDFEETEHTVHNEKGINRDNCYQLVNLPRLEQWLNENCVCRCHLYREIDRFTRHCTTYGNQMTGEDVKEIAQKWKLARKERQTLTLDAKNYGVEPIITMECSSCQKKRELPNDTTKYFGYRYDGVPTTRPNSSWFTSNLRLVMGTLASGMGATEISTLASFIGLPNIHSFSEKAFKKIEMLVGKCIREVANKSMDLALNEEVKLTQEYKKVKQEDWKTSEQPVGLTVSYDMGWSKRSSGRTYDSISGHAFFVGGHSRKIVSCKVTSKQCSTCQAAEGKGISPIDHECPKNHEGSSKSMEADGALHLVKELDKRGKDDCGVSKLFVEAFVTDDDSSIRAILSHDKSKKKNGKGKLPEHIPEPKWLADPSHRTRVVARVIFALATVSNKQSECQMIDAHRFKKYYGYMLKQCKNLTLEEISVRSKAVLYHLFNDHDYCDDSWCVHLRTDSETCNESKVEDADGSHNTTQDVNSKTQDSDTNKKLSYYRCKIQHAELLEQIREAYYPYITPERLLESLHPFDTQLNEALNNVIARYAPKNRTYGMTMSLTYRIFMVVGIHNLGHYRFWLEVFNLLGLDMSSDLKENLQRLDKRKVWKREYEGKPEIKSKRRKLHHQKMQEQLKKQIEDSKRGAMYRTGIAIKDVAPSEVIKLENVYREKNNIHCKFYGCRGKHHLTNISRNCYYFDNRDADSLSKAMRTRLSSLYPNLYYCQEVND